MLNQLRRDWSLRYLPFHKFVRGTIIPYGKYYPIGFDTLHKANKRDTIFIMGSGPSINHLTNEQIRYIHTYGDSFGINYSFVKFHYATYHIMEDGKTEESRNLLAREIRFLDGKDHFKYPGIWLIPSRQAWRLIHPRYAPELFPPTPMVSVFELPERIFLNGNRPFFSSDFTRTAYYRGTMSLAITLALQWGYRNIVLLGVDLHTNRRFYDQIIPELSALRHDSKHSTPAINIPRGGYYRTMEEYLYAVNDYSGANLFVQSKNSLLYPKIRDYDWGQNMDKNSRFCRA